VAEQNEIINFFETPNLLRLNHKEIENVNRAILGKLFKNLYLFILFLIGLVIIEVSKYYYKILFLP
jgi:hypothetical protein